MRRSASRRLATVTAASVAALAAVSFGTVGAAGASGAKPYVPAHLPSPVPMSAHAPRIFTGLQSPPTTAQCQQSFGISCYNPKQYQRAYQLGAVYKSGITGAGKTIAIVDAFGSPTIEHDLAVFDKSFGLPAANIEVIHPAGAPAPFDGSDPVMVNWAFETTLDMEYAHAVAPGAKLLLVETPEAETEGPVGFPDMMYSEQYVVQHHMADVITQSFGATENTFTHPSQDIRSLRYAFEAAAKAGVTVLGSSGDDGATDATTDGSGTYPYRVNSWPSSDPLVTSVGGTMLSLRADGSRIKRDVVWNDGYGAGGGGLSEVFTRPAFQNSVKGVVGSMRGTPDISMSAAVNGAAIVYLSYPGLQKGFYLVGGTSEAGPLFSGIVALADQSAGHDLGNINAALYGLGGTKANGIVDVTQGNNSFAGVTGFTAKPGYDLASGWGTVNAMRFVKHLG